MRPSHTLAGLGERDGGAPDGALVGHQGGVLSISFNESGAYCLTCGKDRTVRLWNPRKALLVKTYGDAHAHEVRDACCARDNSRIASCGGDRQVFLYDVSSGRTIRKFRGHESAPVNSVKFAAQDTVLFSGGHDATVKAWDCRSQSVAPIQTLTDFRDGVTSLHVQEYQVLAGSVDGTVRTFDVRTGQLVTDSFGPPVTHVSLSRDAQCTLVGVLDSKVLLLDRSSGELLAQYEGHKNKCFKVDCCLTHDDAFVISGSEDGNVYFWNLVEADLVKSFTVNPSGGPATCIAWHPEGKYLLTSSAGGAVNIFKTASAS